MGGLVGYIARDDPQAAEQFGFDIVAKTHNLRDFPRLGRIVPEFKSETIRELIHRPYRIVYLVKEGAKVVEILRVWHGARGTPVLIK